MLVESSVQVEWAEKLGKIETKEIDFFFLGKSNIHRVLSEKSMVSLNAVTFAKVFMILELLMTKMQIDFGRHFSYAVFLYGTKKI